MQPLLDGPRASLDGAQVTALLSGDKNIATVYGLDRLDSHLNFIQDLSGFVGDGSTVQRDNTANVHGTCDLNLSSDCPIDYMLDFVRPWQILTNNDTGFAAKFFLGVYSLTSPTFDNSVSPSVYSVTGYDQIYYLTQPIGDTVQFLAGTSPIDNVTALLTQVLLNDPTIITTTDPSGRVLSADATYAFNDNNSWTYLSVINDQLTSIGYNGIWCDWNGAFRVEPFAVPIDRDSEWLFDLTSNDNVVAEARTSDQDYFSVPNYWVFVMNGLTAAPVEGTTQYTYVDMNPSNPASFPNRGRYMRKLAFVDAPDFASLVQAGRVVINTDLAPVETIDVNTSPFPLAWHQDQSFMIDPNLIAVPPANSQYRRLTCQTWSLPLDGQTDMSWEWETVSLVD